MQLQEAEKFHKLRPTHTAADDGTGKCSECGKPTANYSGVVAHKRGRTADSPAKIEVSGDPELSLKNRIRAVLNSLGMMDDIGQLLDNLRRTGHPSTTLDVTKALWGLQKQGFVAFEERKAGSGNSVLVKIHLARGVVTKVHRNGESKGRHPVGKDMTDPRQHKPVAVAISGDKPKETPKPEIVPTVTYVTQRPEVEVPRYAGATPLAQNTKPVIDEEIEDLKKPQVTEVTRIGMGADTHTQYPDVTVDNFPNMFRLRSAVARNQALEDAAEGLLAIDEIAANQLLERIVKFNPLELEVIRFLQSRD